MPPTAVAASLVAAGLVGLADAISHYSRDVVGALEVPLRAPQADGGLALPSSIYSLLSMSLYYAPSAVVPFIAGLYTQAYGAPRCFLVCCASASIGAALSLCALAGESVTMFPLLVGRVFLGVAYEPLDTFTPLLAPLFPSTFMRVNTLINASQVRASLGNVWSLPTPNRTRSSPLVSI